MNVPYNYLPMQFKNSNKIISEWKKLIKTSDFTLGKFITDFEKKFARYIGARYVISTNNGTDALILCLKSIGISKGDEVITVSNTFYATVGAIVACGAKPILVDCDERYQINIDEIKKKIKNIDIIKAMMPGGSVIGCPKINTLNLLNNQEKENRNIYTGSFGFIKFNGDMRFNIIIRSILNYKNISEISVASGVVIDSNAKHEFYENFIKAKALIDLYK